MINIKIKEQIKIIDIANELRKSFYQYSMSVIIGRALPDGYYTQCITKDY